MRTALSGAAGGRGCAARRQRSATGALSPPPLPHRPRAATRRRLAPPAAAAQHEAPAAPSAAAAAAAAAAVLLAAAAPGPAAAASPLAPPPPQPSEPTALAALALPRAQQAPPQLPGAAAAAPQSLFAPGQQQRQQRAEAAGPALNLLAVTADALFGPGRHWIVKILEIGVLNVLGFLAVQQVVKGFLDSSTPVTLVRLRCALRETQHGGGLRRRLGEMRELGAAGPEGLWLALEEAVNEINARHRDVVFAEASAAYFTSQHAALDAFKRVAFEEADRADAEEEAHVRPEPPSECAVDWEAPRPGGRGGGLPQILAGPLNGLFGGGGAGHTDDCQEMVVVTLVVTARGSLDIPTVTGWPSLRHALQQLCGVSRSSIMAIELLWAPDDAADFLTAGDVIQDYPTLVDLSTGRPVGDRAGGGAAQTPAAA